MSIPAPSTAAPARVVQSIPVAWIRPNPYQPRRNFSERSIDELALSIRRYGLMQPIVVRRVSAAQYELIAGERRLRAARRAGLVQIDALVQAAGEEDSAVMALIENVQRENLHFFDEAEAFKKLLQSHGLTQEELARRVGKNQSTIANKLRILKLPPAVRDAIYTGGLTERHARTLLRIPDKITQLELVRTIRQESLSVKATEALVERILNRQFAEQETPRKRRITGVVRDGRLLLNGIKKLVGQAVSTGLSAQSNISDKGDRLEITIVIPKH
ncbi:MAG: ParB/RepB/Spo0J family partition protein [Clostridia bacterium]|nr:ParB/RepB/Spo0J family partition protein [Clostridia bacterium]